MTLPPPAAWEYSRPSLEVPQQYRHASTQSSSSMPSRFGPSSSSSLLTSLRRVNRQSHSGSNKNQGCYIAPATDCEPGVQPELEELNWSGDRVLWTRDGIIHKTYSYSHHGQQVAQALFVTFQDLLDPSLQSHSTASDSTSTRLHPASSTRTFGLFQPSPPPSWSDDPLPLPNQPTPQQRQAPANFVRYLVVLLADIAFAYPPNGGSIPFQLPFHVHRAWPLKHGMLLERAREGKEALRSDEAASAPTLYSLLHPQEEMSVVSSTSTLSGLFSAEPVSTHGFGFRQPLQDFNERLLLASDRRHDSEPVLVTANASSGRLSVWSYARVLPPSDAPNRSQSTSKTTKGKSKENVTSHLAPSMSRMDRTMSSSGKRKRSSLHGPGHSSTTDRDRDRSTRRISLGDGVGSSSLALAGSADEMNFLEALEEKIGGASSMKRGASAMSTGLSSSDRRTSVTRNELSITMDRMALGHGSTQGMPGEMDREATMFADEVNLNKHASDILMAKVWEMDLSSGGANVFQGTTACIFNTRHAISSTLAVNLPSSSTVLLFDLRRSDIGAVEVSPMCQVPAVSATPIILTRPQVLDLLLLKTDGHLAVATVNGHLENISTPHLPPGRTLSSFIGSLSSTALAELDDGTMQALKFIPPPSGVTGRCLQALSLVLPMPDFLDLNHIFHSSRIDSSTRSDLDALSSVLETFSGMTAAESGPQRYRTDTLSSDPIYTFLRSSKSRNASVRAPLSRSCTLSSHLEAVLTTLHLVAQDLKLSTTEDVSWIELAHLIRRLASAVGLPAWTDSYNRQLGGQPLMTRAPYASPSPAFAKTPPSLVKTLQTILSGGPRTHTFALADVSSSNYFVPSLYFGDVTPLQTTVDFLELFDTLAAPAKSAEGYSAPIRCHRTVLKIFQKGWTPADINRLPFGVGLPLREAIRICQLDAPEDWPAGAYSLIHRPDLRRQYGDEDAEPLVEHKNDVRPVRPPSIDDVVKKVQEGVPLFNLDTNSDEITSVVPKAVRFNEDRRLEEVERMLQFERPVTVGGDRTIDQLTPQVQQTLLLAVSNRTLALPIGYSIFSFKTKSRTDPGSVQMSPINTSARLLPMSSPVALAEKETRDGVGERLEWPEFHAGVSAALRLDSRSMESFDGAQIALDKPEELNSRHAGYLLGLGLTGQISSLAFNQTFEYLKMKHDPTSIGILLGLAATYVGTGDPKVTNLISVHLAALHPPHSAPLHVSGATQAAGLVGIGLLYLGTQRRTLADTMVRELCSIKVTSVEDPPACREAYALSAGFSFGFIMLASGVTASATPGEADLLRTFGALILGDSIHPLPGFTSTQAATDVNITSSAATIALSLMYLKSGRKDVADVLEIPDTEPRLDYVRSDLLLLRTMARSIIMWDDTRSSRAWVESQVPQFMSEAVEAKPGRQIADIETGRWNIIAGACFAIGLKFAGTATAEAHGTLIHYLDRLTRASYSKAGSVQAKIKRHAIRSCLDTVAIALSMVMAGTGELNVLRRLRVAHGHLGDGVSYGTHMASHMALGLLLAGAGRYTLGTSNAAVASLLLAFYPAFPSTPTENRAHLQAYRHFWVLAAEPRSLEARDVDSGEATFLPIRLRLNEEGSSTAVRAKQLVAPTLIPELHLVQTIQVDTPRYWNFALNLASNPTHLRSFLQNGTLFVKRKTGHLSYASDPRGIRSIFTRSKSETGSAVIDLGETARLLSPSTSGLRDFVKSFSSDLQAIAAVEHLCHPPDTSPLVTSTSPSAFEAFCASTLLECLTRDKRDTISVYLAIYQATQLVSLDPTSPQALNALEQLQFVLECHRPGGPISSITAKSNSKSKNSGQGASTPRESLLQPAFLDHVAQVTKNLLSPDRAHDGNQSLRVALQEYFAYSRWPQAETERVGLAAYLVFHGVPDIAAMEKLRELVLGVRRRAEAAGLDPAQTRISVDLLMRGTKKMLESVGKTTWTVEFADIATSAWLDMDMTE